LERRISHKVFLKSFCKSQFPHKSVNLSFTITNIKDMLTELNPKTWETRLACSSSETFERRSAAENDIASSTCRGSEAGSYLRLIDFCSTQRKAQGPSRTCNESKEEEGEDSPARPRTRWPPPPVISYLLNS